MDSVFEINSCEKLFEVIGKDLSHGDEIPKAYQIMKAYIKMPCYRLIVWLRIYQYLKFRRAPYVVPYLHLQHYKSKLGIDVNISTPTGAGLSIVHGGAVYLNAERIGENCTFYQGVTLGTGAKGLYERPIIEDDVIVYTGAVIVGGVTLHSGCVIGANSVVTHDVPANALVVGAPAKVIKMMR